MKKLLTLIGTNVLMTTSIIPVIETLNTNIIISKSTSFSSQTNNPKQMNAEINISHSKHKDENGDIIVGTKDYKEEFAKNIHDIRAKLVKANADKLKISNITTKFKDLSAGTIQLPEETFLDLLTAQNVEIIATEVTISRATLDLYYYKSSYTAIIDGKKVTRNLNGYEARKVFLPSQVMKPYTIKFDINYSKAKLKLDNILKDFKFSDEKNVKGFLDANNLTIITRQIETYLGASLNQIGLTLESQQATSIILKAKPESKKYQGEITLTWNLKLFEIYGGATKADNIWIQKGIKGYFYLEHTTNQIKYFNVLGYLSNSSSPINPKVDDYHKFSFKNQNNQEKNFTFNGKKWTTTIAESFDSFAFTKEVKVVVDSPELDKVKIFDAKTNNWKGLNKASTFLIDNLGQINELS